MHDGESDEPGGGPPTVLVAALGAALLIAVGVIAAFASLGGGDSSDATSGRTTGSATTATGDDRVLLMVSVGGTGIGRVQIEPSDVSCSASCEYRIRSDTRVTATVRPSPGSTFEGWGDACSGRDRCSFVMDRARTLSATFVEKPVADPLCDEGLPPEERDPTCPSDDLADPEAPAPPPEPGPDCADNRDNDDDGLTDTAQDPDCETSGSEFGTALAPDDAASPPPPAAIPNECTDGEDNDNDGLTDREQDPDCEKGRFESG
ncbi:MAG TPA: hypothetical protein VGV90_09905 [Solirubrobacteraceae bacterium]|nr:hypothetical protein [Solirubrobacteraceae bacterium]